MTLIALAVLTAPTSSFDRAVSAHSALRAAHVVIEGMALTNGEKVAFRDTIDFGPKYLLVSVKHYPSKAQPRLERSACTDGAEVLGYDSLANETVRSKAPKGSLVEQVDAVLALDEPTHVVLSPEYSRYFLGAMKKAGKFSTQRIGDLICLKGLPKPKSDNSVTTLYFDSRGLIVRFEERSRKRLLKWSFRYAPPLPRVALGAPKSAHLVLAFSDPRQSPVYATPEAGSLAAELKSAFDRLSSGEIVTQREESTISLLFAKNCFRQADQSGSWAFDGSQISAKQGGKFYHVSAKRSTVLDALGKIGAPVDSLTRAMLTRHNPFRDWLVAGAKVSRSGQLVVEGVPCDILTISTPINRVTMFVRRDIRLPATVESENIGPDGAVLSRSLIRYRYHRLSTQIPTEEFHLTPPSGGV